MSRKTNWALRHAVLYLNYVTFSSGPAVAFPKVIKEGNLYDGVVGDQPGDLERREPEAASSWPRPQPGFAGYAAHDQTCGWQTGSWFSEHQTTTGIFSVGCDPSSTCVVSGNPQFDRDAEPTIGCCAGGSCSFYTALKCLEPWRAVRVCPSGCGPLTTACPATAPWCVQSFLPGLWGMASAWSCHKNQPGNFSMSFTPSAFGMWFPDSTTTIAVPTSSRSASNSASPASQMSSSTPSATSPAIFSQTPTDSSSPSPPHPSLPVGAIAGVAIGGIALLGLIGCVLFYIHKKFSAKGDENLEPPPDLPPAMLDMIEKCDEERRELVGSPTNPARVVAAEVDGRDLPRPLSEVEGSPSFRPLSELE